MERLFRILCSLYDQKIINQTDKDLNKVTRKTLIVFGKTDKQTKT
jgi:hypothetical protein